MNQSIPDLWTEFSQQLLLFIKSKVKNPYDAEDILQDVFIKIYQNVDKLEDHSKLKSWLYRITKNTIIDFYRKNKDLPIEIEYILNEMIMEQESDNMNKEIAGCLASMIFDLPNKYKAPLEYYEIEGKQHKEIAEKLNISLSGSKTRVQRARKKLKDIIIQCCDLEVDPYGNIVSYQEKHPCDCDNNCKKA